MIPTVFEPLSTLDGLEIDPGSFRDPSGWVGNKDGRIIRIITERGADEFRWVRDRGLLDTLERGGFLVPTREISATELGLEGEQASHVLEHQRVRFLSYPYEWSFSALQTAALFHLDLHLALLEHAATLVDASAYNVQFEGARPVFIDVLSLRRYRDGQLWDGHRQFCEQFLHPLLLTALRGVPFNAWYRGAMEGIPASQLSAVLSPRQKASWRVLAHVVAPAKLQRAAERGRLTVQSASTSKRTLPKRSLIGLLQTLRNWIARLEPHAATASPHGWSAYAAHNTYAAEEAAAKQRFIADFAAVHRPRQLLDLGCNSGDYAAAALASGAESVIGLESDPATADRAFRRAFADRLNFLPLVIDAADPSPARGWRGLERRAFSQRASFDGLMALAFEHHLAIGRNIPLDQLIAWLTGLAPCGVIEFVEKDDPTIQRMLALRDDIFDGYSRESFTSLLSRHARIVRQETISSSGRVLFWYEHDRG